MLFLALEDRSELLLASNYSLLRGNRRSQGRRCWPSSSGLKLEVGGVKSCDKCEVSYADLAEKIPRMFSIITRPQNQLWAVD